MQAHWFGKNGFGFIKICLVSVWKTKVKPSRPLVKANTQYSRTFTDQKKKMNTKLINPTRKLVVGTEIREHKTKQKLLPLARLKSKLAPNM